MSERRTQEQMEAAIFDAWPERKPPPVVSAIDAAELARLREAASRFGFVPTTALVLALLGALEKALRPAPSQSDEAAGEALARYIEAWWSDSDDSSETPSQRVTAALATVRAEERERAAKWHDDRARQTPDVFEQEFHEVSASAIRAGVTADEWVALSTRKP